MNHQKNPSADVLALDKPLWNTEQHFGCRSFSSAPPPSLFTEALSSVWHPLRHNQDHPYAPVGKNRTAVNDEGLCCLQPAGPEPDPVLGVADGAGASDHAQPAVRRGQADKRADVVSDILVVRFPTVCWQG